MARHAASMEEDARCARSASAAAGVVGACVGVLAFVRARFRFVSLLLTQPHSRAPSLQMFQTLYGQTAAALYAKAAGQNAQARQLYNASADTYYKANDAAAYDDWVRARNHWDYFYNRS